MDMLVDIVVLQWSNVNNIDILIMVLVLFGTFVFKYPRLIKLRLLNLMSSQFSLFVIEGNNWLN